MCVFVHKNKCATYFSISLFLQVRGTQEEEQEDEGVLESVLLLSPLLVEGISVSHKQDFIALIHIHKVNVGKEIHRAKVVDL